MRWFFSTLSRRAAAESHRILSPSRHAPRSYQGRFFFSRAGATNIGRPHCRRPDLSPSSPLLAGHSYLTIQQRCFHSSLERANLISSSDDEKTMQPDIEIISKGSVKPAFPTPHHLRKYKLTVLDEICLPLHLPLTLFYPNNENGGHLLDTSDKLHHLKHSLSETLSLFYPFAGKVKDEVAIDCNDEGVHYVEARLNHRLSDFLNQPDHNMLRKLIPLVDPNSISGGIHLLMIQVNVFYCGGIAICTSASHKLLDGHSYATFIKAWAAISRRSPKLIYPSFIAPTIFHQNPNVNKLVFPTVIYQEKFITRRFLFHASALATLKTKIGKEPSRVEAVSALIWKCALSAYRSRNNDSHGPSFFVLPVSLRKRSSPPLPEHAIGNLIWFSYAKCTPETKAELPSMVDHIRKAIRGVNGELVEEMKGEKGLVKMDEYLREWNELMYAKGGLHFLCITSVNKTGIYESDFGWGKPLWFYPSMPGIINQVILADTRSGDGIEAWVNLSEEEMAMFEQDADLVAATSMDPSPLQL